MCRYARSRDTYRFGMSDATLLLAEIHGSSYSLVRFTGGEPLMLPDLDRIVLLFANAGLATSVITNGWFLPAKARTLAKSGLREVIVSLDSATANKHDALRETPGLFERCVTGIIRWKRESPDVSVRVNTVVDAQSVRELIELHELLVRLGVDSWSLAPRKGENGLVACRRELDVTGSDDEFLRAVAASPRPRLLGYSAYWSGRDAEERRRFLNEHVAFTPRDSCHLVDAVRYYTPKDGRVYCCNCIPHRAGGRHWSERAIDGGLSSPGLSTIRDWLAKNAPSTCKGCEPVNVALGEMRTDLDSDLLGF
jgi:cytosylglucuronate decarboxylase